MTDRAASTSLRLLLIEDSDLDAALWGEALRLASHAFVVCRVGSGHEALKQVHRQPFDLIVTDLHLPGMDGFQVLQALKADPSTKLIPTVVLTGSASDAEVRRAYELQASAVMSKSASFDALLLLAERLGDYWQHTLRVPT